MSLVGFDLRCAAFAAAATMAATAPLMLAPAATANPLSPIWTGIYVGAHGGASWADVDVANIGAFDTTRAALGGHAGYNVALGKFVVGIEADASHAGTSTDLALAGGGTATVETDWAGTVRGRLGLAVGPALFYATAGWAWTNVQLTEISAAGTRSSSSTTFDGVVYGIGVDAFVLPAISVRLEALRTDYRSETLSLEGAASSLRHLDHGDTVVRAGVTVHFR